MEIVYFGECFMSLIAHYLPLKMRANTAATDTNCTAVATREPSAAFVSFQWHHPDFPPTQNVNSVVLGE